MLWFWKNSVNSGKNLDSEMIHLVKGYSFNNHHGAEISTIRLVERNAIKLLILLRYYGKANFEVQRNFNVTLH